MILIHCYHTGIFKLVSRTVVKQRKFFLRTYSNDDEDDDDRDKEVYFNGIKTGASTF